MSAINPDISARDGDVGLLQGYVRKIRGGDLGSLPVILGLVVIWIVFESQNSKFLTAGNLSNLMLQVTAVGTVSVGIVLVLLLGEIDLSVSYVSALASGVTSILLFSHGWSGIPAIAAGILTGTAVGLFQGFFITKLRVPSFVVTLAGFIGWQGLFLRVLGSTGTVPVSDSYVLRLTNTFFSKTLGWALGIAIVAIVIAQALMARRQRVAHDLEVPPLVTLVLRLVVIAAGILIAIGIFNRDRGVPLAVVIFVGIVVIVQFVISRTTFGRYVFAVGGNPEAARRAGIPVDRIKIVVFTLCSTIAAIGGILAASRGLSVSQSSGSGDFLLNAIAGAVIGGTSLFGGRGSAWSALLGALVIGSISNGMGLLSLASSSIYMVTGAVLLAAVVVDSTARRGREASGRG